MITHLQQKKKTRTVSSFHVMRNTRNLIWSIVIVLARRLPDCLESFLRHHATRRNFILTLSLFIIDKLLICFIYFMLYSIVATLLASLSLKSLPCRASAMRIAMYMCITLPVIPHNDTARYYHMFYMADYPANLLALRHSRNVE